MASWKDDGSGNVTVNGAEVKCSAEAKGEVKGNAMWSAGAAGTWEFKVAGPSGAWIGVSSEDKFGAGWAMKGLFYGGPGNLSDGGGLVTGHWGPSFADGDVVNMRVEQAGDNVSIAYSKNGQGLGEAFKIEGFSGNLQPAVSFNKPGQGVTISSAGAMSLDAMQKSMPESGIEGDWKGRFEASVKKQAEDLWSVSFKVGNNMSCAVKQSGDVFTPGPVRSTKMMPPPELQDLEREAGAILAGLTSMRREGNQLILEGDGKREVMEFSLHGHGPASKAQINWMN